MSEGLKHLKQYSTVPGRGAPGRVPAGAVYAIMVPVH